MPRPKVPLISRRKALEAALEIVDKEGLDALSIRRLGEALHVNGASLYHHFKNKDEILVGVTQLALADITAPRSDSDNWRVWLPVNTYRTRAALITHPQLISLMLRRVPLGIGSEEVEKSVARLKAEGVPPGLIAPLMESLELLAIASALQAVGGADIAGNGRRPHSHEGSEYSEARAARALSDEELFEVVIASLITSVENATHMKQVRASNESTKPRRTAKTPSKRASASIQPRGRSGAAIRK